MSKRWVRAALSVAVLAGGTAVAFQLATGSAAADDFAVPLPVASAADLVVDGAHKRIFISDPAGGKLITTDYTGKVLATTSAAGVGDLLLSDNGDRLYAALWAGEAIVAFDPATSARVATYPTGAGVQPGRIVQVGEKIWFGENDAGLGSLDLSGPEPVVTQGLTGNTRPLDSAYWHESPLLAVTPSRPGVIAAVGDRKIQLVDITTAPPAVLASRYTDGVWDMAFNPDGSRLIVTGHDGIMALSTTDLKPMESYRRTGTIPNGVAVRPDGTIAISAGEHAPVVALYTPGTASPVKQLPIPALPSGSTIPTSFHGSTMAWEPDGRRIFGVARKDYTNATDPKPTYSFLVLNGPRSVAVRLAVPAEAVPGQTYSVSGSFSTPVPAGLPMVITRTDPGTPGGKQIGPETVPTTGSFEFQDSQPVAGKVTYTVRFAGNDDFSAATAVGSVMVDVPKAATTLTLDRSGSVHNSGTSVTFTARLGVTRQSRTVEIWADPYGTDQPNRLIRKALVDGKGILTANVKLARNTTISAVFRGDAGTKPTTAKSTVSVRAAVATAVSRHYKVAKLGSTPYHYFRKTRHPMFTTTMSPYPGRKAYMQIDVYTRGKWILWGPAYYYLDEAGKLTKELAGTHSTGMRYRVRFAYLYDKSGDTANATAYGPYRYFTFTR